LLGGVDAVLVDLRGLTARNGGVLTEIGYLVATVPLRKVVALLDHSTDTTVLQWVLDGAAATAPDSSPLHADPSPTLRVVPLTGQREKDVTRVLSALARAADAAPSGATDALSSAPPQGQRAPVHDRPHATTEG
jgi:hypothetical protein